MSISCQVFNENAITSRTVQHGSPLPSAAPGVHQTEGNSPICGGQWFGDFIKRRHQRKTPSNTLEEIQSNSKLFGLAHRLHEACPRAVSRGFLMACQTFRPSVACSKVIVQEDFSWVIVIPILCPVRSSFLVPDCGFWPRQSEMSIELIKWSPAQAAHPFCFRRKHFSFTSKSTRLVNLYDQVPLNGLVRFSLIGVSKAARRRAEKLLYRSL